MRFLAACSLLILLASCTPAASPDEPVRVGGASPLTLTSAAFAAGAPIPQRFAYTGEGENVSPPLAWSGVPAGAQELALICDDPDAPSSEPWVHWVLYGIPASASGLAEGETGGAVAGQNGWGEAGWGGPFPPPGHGVHHYHFKLYALDAPVGLAPGATKPALLQAIEGHVLATAELVGTYERK